MLSKKFIEENMIVNWVIQYINHFYPTATILDKKLSDDKQLVELLIKPWDDQASQSDFYFKFSYRDYKSDYYKAIIRLDKKMSIYNVAKKEKILNRHAICDIQNLLSLLVGIDEFRFSLEHVEEIDRILDSHTGNTDDQFIYDFLASLKSRIIKNVQDYATENSNKPECAATLFLLYHYSMIRNAQGLSYK